ncbi:hypothetical protein CROQUDRAFT_667739 [Cronartium quercuum f. sp. fusiforme G11]|uniref:Uncharacterized protein n=1 Tax=Cronartium quercuum f. sp. fusiforme G11 TaxID=708437 RepID=A0A9P6NX01_9BASI|nr:hypothetical protein CROQUDRAFT_667739 [Cronartium quercuum f. sp. fusiforme G11]
MKETLKKTTFRWQNTTGIGDATRHEPLMNVSLYTVKTPKGKQNVKLEINPLGTPAYNAHYGQNRPVVSWKMNVGTTSSPDAFLDTSRTFTKTGPSDQAIIDLGSTTEFIETLEQSKDILVFTLFIRNYNDPDVSSLLQDRREHRDKVKNLSNLLGIHSQLFNDPCPETVRFVFPQRSGRMKYLYALETVLRSAKYFANLLDSQFSETSWQSSSDDMPSSSKKPRLEPSPHSTALPEQSTSIAQMESNLDPELEGDVAVEDEPVWWNGDSDDESDDPTHDIDEYEMPAERFKATVVVTDTPYPTYRALLKYMFSGSICFAPLRSTYLSEKRAARRKGEDFENLQTFIQNRSTKIMLTECELTPTSPKSIYVLADKLIMPELQKLAKHQILNSLTPSNIFNEIKTEMCIRYPELRACYIQYLQEHRNEAMSSETLQEIVIAALGKSGREIEDVLREVFQKSLTPIAPPPPPKLPMLVGHHHPLPIAYEGYPYPGVIDFEVDDTLSNPSEYLDGWAD